MERYVSFTKHIVGSRVTFRFIDSFRFMASPLEKLASYLDTDKKTIVKREFVHLDDGRLKLFMKKGVFPYEYLDSWAKLDKVELPPTEALHSGLKNSDISAEDYSHAQAVWREFDICTLGEYSDLYLKTDVLLLADVFEKFRSDCHRAYDLDPAHYYTAPRLTWDAMLIHTGIELQLLTDSDMVLSVKRSIRGGISQCSYSRANNPYSTDYNPTEDTTYLMYYDVNNLWGWVVMQHLPYGGFEWVENFEQDFPWHVADDSEIGYILEVDLDYREHIHDSPKDLPFCLEKMSPPGSKESKLLTTVLPKTPYNIHYRNLRQALNHGLILRKIHRILRFKQSAWLKTYIDLNSDKRTTAKNEFEKNLFKLMNNAVFGKTMENGRKPANIKLVTKWTGRYGAEALNSKPNFKARSIFHENFSPRVQVFVRKETFFHE